MKKAKFPLMYIVIPFCITVILIMYAGSLAEDFNNEDGEDSIITNLIVEE